MSDLESEILTSDGEIKKGMDVLETLGNRLAEHEERKVVGRQPGAEEAMVVAHLISSYYTCAETLFLRISRFFENSLPGERWHQALLEKMALSIEGVRPAVLSDQQCRDLVELLKFRHFNRYYFELDYDWDKLEFLLKKFKTLRPGLINAFEHFRSYLKSLRRG